jgi:hypothetical protein
MAEIPKCPNNPRHGELVPHGKGGLTCEKCQEERTARSKTPTRWGNPS